MRKNLNRWLASGLLASAAVSGTAVAGPYGYDLNNVFAPRSGGMAGTSIAKPLDNVSAIFGNPATLADWQGTEFTFGATFYKPEANLDHDGTVTDLFAGGGPGSGAFSTRNGNEGYIVPQVGVTQDLRPLGLPAVLGAGLTAISGIGVEFRNDPLAAGLGAEFIVLGANFALGYELSENLSVGGGLTVTYAYLDLGLASSSGVAHDTSARFNVGVQYDVMPDTTVGLMYHSELQHVFDDIIAVPGTNPGGLADFQALEIEQPRTVGIGIANTSLMGGNLLLAADVMFKNWSRAAFWGDVYKDQMIYSIGGELSAGPWRFRGGYGFADDPTDRNASGVRGLPLFCADPNCSVGPVGGAVPLGGAVLELLQASQTQVIYRHRASLGLGYKGFLAPFLDLDTHVAWQFQEENTYGGHTTSTVWSRQAGFALTWHFQ